MTRLRFFPMLPGVFLIACILGIASPNHLLGQTVPKVVAEFSPSGAATVSAKLIDGTPVTVAISRTQFNADTFPYTTHDQQFPWAGWGTELELPNTVVTTINVKMDEKDVWVNMSSYSDLGNPNMILFEDTSIGHEDSGELLIDKVAFRLIVFGGESSTAYRAELHFSNSGLERRVVWLGEFPTEIGEETRYWIKP